MAVLPRVFALLLPLVSAPVWANESTDIPQSEGAADFDLFLDVERVDAELRASPAQFEIIKESYDPDQEITLGSTVGLKLKGTGDKVKVDAFLEQGQWEMRGKFLTGNNPIDVRGVMVRIERPVDWFDWLDD